MGSVLSHNDPTNYFDFSKLNRKKVLEDKQNASPESKAKENIFQDLEDKLLEKILSYLTYKEIANLRMVNKKFDNACKTVLNKGFTEAQNLQLRCMNIIGMKLRVRKSLRRSHPLALHYYLLSRISCQLGNLQSSFGVYMQNQQICFAPGKLLDELFRVLLIIESMETLTDETMLSTLETICEQVLDYFPSKIFTQFEEKDNNLIAVLENAHQHGDGITQRSKTNDISNEDKIKTFGILLKKFEAEISSVKLDSEKHSELLSTLKKHETEFIKIVTELECEVSLLKKQVKAQETVITDLTVKIMNLEDRL